jgi:hypothetical protein
MSVAAAHMHSGNVFMELTQRIFRAFFLVEIVQNTHFDTRLTAPEGKSGVPCLAVFFICAGSTFVHLFNQAHRLSVLSDFKPQPRVKVGILYNIAQYFCRKMEG